MAIKIKCPKPECQKVLQVPEDMGGKKGKCSACGTTFLIPKVESPAAAPPPAPSKPAPPPKQQPPARPQADHVEDFDIDDDFSPEPIGRRGGGGDAFDAGYDDRPRRGRRPAPPPSDYDEFDDDFDDYGGGGGRGGGYDDYDDDYDEYGGGGGGGVGYQAAPRGPRKTSWKWVKTGMFICAIGFCVTAGTMALRLLVDVLSLIQAITIQASTSFNVASGFGKAINIIAKINAPIMLGGIATIVTGLGFCIASTARGGVMGLAIASTAVGGAEFIMRLIFRVVYLYSSVAYDRMLFANPFAVMAMANVGRFGFGSSITSFRVGVLLLDLLTTGFFIVVALLFASIATQVKYRNLKGQSMTAMYMVISAGGVSLLYSILAFINWGKGYKVMVWIFQIMNIAADVLFGLGMLFFATMLFGAKRRMKA